MNVSSGGLSFNFTAQNDQLRNIVQQSKNDIQGLSDASKVGGAQMDAAFKAAFNHIEDYVNQVETAMSGNRQAIMKLKAEMETLKAKAGQLYEDGATGAFEEAAAVMELYRAKERELKQREAGTQACYDALDALDQQRQGLENMQASAERSGNAQQSLRAQLRKVREELALLESTQGVGVRQTEHFRELQQQAGALADALSDAQAQTAVFSDDNAMITGVIGGISGVAGAFSAVQGAMSMFGVENEKVQEAMLKVQSAMAITTGLQQVMTAVNKDSAFMLVVVQKAKDALTAANTRLSVALGISTVAAKALMATLTLGLSVAITALIFMWDKFSSKTEEAAKQTEATRKAFENYHKTTASKSADLVGKYQQLADEYKKLKTEAEKTQWIKDNASAMDGLGLAVNGVTDADNIFINNSAKVVKALELRAKAMALQELQMKAYEEYYDKVINADQTVAGGGFYTKFKGGTIGTADGSMPDEWKQAGVTISEANYEWGGGQSGAGWFKPTQAAIDKINAYRVKQARATNATIHTDATKALNDTLAYTRKEINLTEKELASLNILKAGGKTTTPTGTGGGKSKTEAELYADDLNNRKALYQKYLAWKTSSDKTVREAADEEFSALLKDGANFRDYLNKQLTALEAMPQTKAVKEKLRLVRDQIAEATKEATLNDFQAQLDADLKGCETLGAMLDLIEKRRKEVAENQTGDVAESENQMLDTAEKDTRAQIQTQLADLLSDYASYTDQRLAIERKFNQDIDILNRARANATTEAERASIDAAIANRTRQKDTDIQGVTVGGINIDALLTEYGTFEQRKQKIIDDFDAKRRAATEAGNTELVNSLNDAQTKALSKLASEELTGSDTWAKLFGNLDDLTAGQIDTLIREIEAKFDTLSGTFNPIDLAAVRDKLTEAKAVVIRDNPFSQMGASLRAIFTNAGDDSKDSSEKIKRNWKQLGTATEASFKFVSDAVNSCEPLKEAIGEVGATALTSLTSIITTSIAVATAIKTAETSSVILAIIQAALVAVQAVYALVKAIAGNNDKKLEKQIEGHKKAVDKLKNAYAALEWQVNKALGEDTYKGQKDMIRNLQQQSAEVSKMINAENEKKEKDEDKIREWQEQQAENARKIQDVMDEITASITQTSAKDLAAELSDALIAAFEGGEDAAKAFGRVADDVIKKAVANAIKLQMLEKPLQTAIKQLQRDMGFNEDGTGTFDGLSESEQKRFKDAVAAAGANFQQAMEVYKDLFTQMDESDPSTLSGAIKGASQESIDLLAGQTNAVRQNQVTALGLFREQLLHLSNIDNNVGTIAGKLQTIINQLSTPNGSNMRAHGITD